VSLSSLARLATSMTVRRRVASAPLGLDRIPTRVNDRATLPFTNLADAAPHAPNGATLRAGRRLWLVRWRLATFARR
jgi:hypothetical protein